MSDALDIDELPDERRTDYRRANGAPLVLVDGKQERFSRSSSIGKTLDDESALVLWKLNRSIKGVASDPALIAKAISLADDDREAWGKLREAAINAGRGKEKADIGTAVHAMSERWEQDPEFDPRDPYRTALEAYDAEMERLGLKSQMFETHMVCVKFRVAGTADRIYELTKALTAPNGDVLPVGTLVIGDLKTSAKLTYNVPGFCIQMAGYANGQLYDVDTDEFLPTPEINRSWGLLMHLNVEEGTCSAHWADLQVGEYGLWLCQEIRSWRADWRKGTYAAPEVDDAVMEAATYADGIGHSPERDTLPTPEWAEQMIPFVKQRVKAAGQHPEARKWLRLNWPDDVPPPKGLSVERPHEVSKALIVLDEVEAHFELPWPEGDPRQVKGVHSSEATVSNFPPESS